MSVNKIENATVRLWFSRINRKIDASINLLLFSDDSTIIFISWSFFFSVQTENPWSYSHSQSSKKVFFCSNRAINTKSGQFDLEKNFSIGMKVRMFDGLSWYFDLIGFWIAFDKYINQSIERK